MGSAPDAIIARGSELDLNLLRVLDALMDTGSVVGAAARLHLSAPATSRALGRLRVALGDPILVRAGRGLVPTGFALQAAARVKVLLAEADGLARQVADDPSTWRRSLSIRVNDGLSPILAPRLLQRVAAEAPGVRLRFVAQDSKRPDALRDGTLDLDVGLAVASPPDVLSSPLLTDRFVAVARADSPLGRAPAITLQDLADVPHIAASPRGRVRGPIDDALEAIGLSRRVVAVVPSYAVAALMTLEDDVVCLLPHRMTAHLAERGLPLREHDVPADLPPVPVEQRWHRRADADPVSRWIRAALEQVARV